MCSCNKHHRTHDSGVYVGSARTRDAIGDYEPFQSGVERTTPDNYVPAEITASEKRFRTTAITRGEDFNETPRIETPAELGKLGLKAIIGPGAYGRSDQPRRAADEALEDNIDDHAENCDCDSCKADRAHGTKDAHMLGLKKINEDNRKAFGGR